MFGFQFQKERRKVSRVFELDFVDRFPRGGIPRGKVVGQSTRDGGEVLDCPVSPKDILATAFHLLGINPETTVPDLSGRPHLIAGEGKVRTELLG